MDDTLELIIKTEKGTITISGTRYDDISCEEAYDADILLDNYSIGYLLGFKIGSKNYKDLGDNVASIKTLGFSQKRRGCGTKVLECITNYLKSRGITKLVGETVRNTSIINIKKKKR